MTGTTVPGLGRGLVRERHEKDCPFAEAAGGQQLRRARRVEFPEPEYAAADGDVAGRVADSLYRHIQRTTSIGDDIHVAPAMEVIAYLTAPPRR